MTTYLHEEGYERLVPYPAEDAVRWWFLHREEEFLFARGGVCPTARRARHLLQEARDQMRHEQVTRASALRPRYVLLEDGSLKGPMIV